MSRLSDRDHVPTVLNRLDVLLLRLGAHPRTRALVPPLVAVRAALAAADTTWNEAVAARMAASLELEYLDGEVDIAWMDLSRDVHAKVGGDRTQPLWQGLYREAPSATVQGTVTDHQIRQVERVIATIEAEDRYAAFRPQAERLKAAHVEALEGQERHLAALAREEAASHRRSLAASEARRAHNRVRPELELLFEDQPRKVRAFWG